MSVYQGEKFRIFISKVKNFPSVYGFLAKPSNEEIANLLGVKPMQLNRYYKSKSLQRETVDRIVNAFNVSIDEIWNDDDEVVSEDRESYTFKGDRLKELLKPVKPKEEITPIPYDDYMMVEYVDLSASAGLLGGSDVDVLPDSKKRLVPREFENGNYLAVRVNGDSMTDGTDISIPDGVEMLVKEYVLENGDKLPIRGNLFVIVSREGTIFKQIVEHNTELGYIRCHSYNPKYEDFNIPMSDIFQIFIYRKIIGYRPNIPEIK